MPRLPSYPTTKHSTGQARIQFRGHRYYLGVWGSLESYTRFAAIVGQQVPRSVIRPVTVGEAVGRFLAAAKSGERKTAAKELAHFEHAAKMLLAAHSTMSAADFDAQHLEEVRNAMLAGNWGRSHVNRQTVRLRTIWRWVEKKRMVPRGSWENLRTLESLDRGQLVKEAVPVPEEHLRKTLDQLKPVTRAMAQVQLLTGARAAEVRILKPGMFQRAGELQLENGVMLRLGTIWAADLGRQHKNGWRGQRRLLLFGAKAQAVIAQFLDRPADAYCFNPRVDQARCYPYHSYRQAIVRACRRAKVPKWTPHQLRKTAATVIAAEHSPEMARIILGQRSLEIARRYITDDLQKAIDTLGKTG